MHAQNTEESGSGRSLLPALLAAAVGLGILFFANAASANCAEPTSYEIAVEGNTVTVCPRNFQGRGCPDPDGMLREALAGGAVVKLDDRCSDPAGAGADDDPACYVDECVPPGEYRYGFALPYSCESASCGTYYFTPVTVTAAVGNCQPSDGGAPQSAAGVPWSGDDDEICGYGGDDDGEGGGCAAGGAPPPIVVFGAQGLALLAGLALILARRARRAPAPTPRQPRG